MTGPLKPFLEKTEPFSQRAKTAKEKRANAREEVKLVISEALIARSKVQIASPMAIKIVFQGEPGANSDIAIRNTYPDATSVPCATFEDCFARVTKGDADLAMIPIDNSLAGRVADIHHLLPRSQLHIVGEYFLPIRFQLMAPPGVDLADITAVYSHVHALGQCRDIIQNHGWAPIVAADTAGSARFVAQSERRDIAALAPRLAASLYGLTILAEDVEDADHNTTRFVILSRDSLVADHNGDQVMTSFVFQVRNIPAALYKALGGFATNGVNMTKLESYQLEGQFIATQFYAEVEAHPESAELQRAMEELDFYSKNIRILGVYPAAPFRAQMTL